MISDVRSLWSGKDAVGAGTVTTGSTKTAVRRGLCARNCLKLGNTVLQRIDQLCTRNAVSSRSKLDAPPPPPRAGLTATERNNERPEMTLVVLAIGLLVLHPLL